MILTNEADARAWMMSSLSVSRETMARLDHYAALLRDGNRAQNLIAESTAGELLWVRHIADSAQLVPLGADVAGDWIDLGSGPGLPGLVVALLSPNRRLVLLETRRLRCEFLRHCCVELGLGDRVTIAETSLAQLATGPFAVISARAFAPLSRLLTAAGHIADAGSRWLLPKGRNAAKELSSLPRAWQERFHVEPSLTDADAAILIGNGVPRAVRPAWHKGKTRQ